MNDDLFSIAIHFIDLALKGHHGMGLHVRPRVGGSRGRMNAAAGVSGSGGTSFVKILPEQGKSLSFKTASEYVDHFHEIIRSSDFVSLYTTFKSDAQKVGDHSVENQRLKTIYQEKLDALRTFKNTGKSAYSGNADEIEKQLRSDVDKASKEWNESNTKGWPLEDEMNKSLEAFEARAADLRDEIHSALFETKRTPAFIPNQDTTEIGSARAKLQQELLDISSKKADIDLFQQHALDGASFAASIVSNDVWKDMQTNARSYWNPVSGRREVGKATVDSSGFLLDYLGYREMLPKVSVPDKIIPDFIKQNFPSKKWQEETENYALDLLKDTSFSLAKVPLTFDLSDNRSAYMTPMGTKFSMKLGGKNIDSTLIEPSYGIELSFSATDIERAYETGKTPRKKDIQTMMNVAAASVHEYSHYIESITPSIATKMSEMIQRRTANAPVQKLKDVYPNQGYSDTEIFQDGGFISPYVGKVYKTSYGKTFEGCSEAFSVGMEQLFLNPVQFLARDRDHFQTIVAAIKSLPVS